MPRNRQLTETRIQDAAKGILIETGFEGWGINAIARKAGVDKVLVYRYFGSLDGLLDVIIETTEFWPDPDSLSDASPQAFLEETVTRMHNVPQAWVLMSHPRLNAAHSTLHRHFTSSRDRWMRGLQARVAGSGVSEQIEQLAAIVHSQAVTGIDDISFRNFWNGLSPSLTWRSPQQADDDDELPVELL